MRMRQQAKFELNHWLSFLSLSKKAGLLTVKLTIGASKSSLQTRQSSGANCETLSECSVKKKPRQNALRVSSKRTNRILLQSRKFWLSDLANLGSCSVFCSRLQAIHKVCLKALLSHHSYRAEVSGLVSSPNLWVRAPSWQRSQKLSGYGSSFSVK